MLQDWNDRYVNLFDSLDNLCDFKSTSNNLHTMRRVFMFQLFNCRYHELQQKYDDISVSNQTLEEQIHFKDNEIEVSNALKSNSH